MPAARPTAVSVVVFAGPLGGVLAAGRPRDAFALLLAAVAVEVAAFTVSQAAALRRTGTAAS